jgi:hypothetical protein
MFGLKKLFATSAKASAARRRRESGRSTIRLGIDHLEDRCVPATVATGSDGTTYAIFNANRQLWAQAPNGSWSHLRDNVSQVAVTYTGIIDVLDTNNIVWQKTPATSYFLPLIIGNGNIGTIATGCDREVYLNWGSSKELWKLDASGWHDLHTSNVVDIGYMGGAVVYANGSLAVAQNGSFKVVVQSGVHHIASGSYDLEILFTWGSDNELWGVDSSTFQHFHNYYKNNVAQVSCFANYVAGGLQQFNWVSTNGVVMVASNLYGSGLIWWDAWTW